MDCNKVSHYLLKLDQFIKYVKDISGKKLATCIIKPPKVAKELAKLTENHCGGRLEFNDKDFKNGVFACLGEMNDEPFYEVWEPWWPLKTGSIEVGNRFSTEDIIKSVPETLHGVIIIRADNAVFATIGNNYKQIGEPATMDLTNMKIIKSFPSMKKVSGLYIFHEADLANVNDMIEVLKHFDPKSKPKVHEFQPDADDVVSVQAGFFDEISAPVVEDWISIRSILANPEGYIFEPRRVIQVLKHGGFKGKVFIWKENNLRVFKYSDVKAKEDVRYVFAAGPVQSIRQEENKQFKLDEREAPTLFDYLQEIMKDSLSCLRVIMTESARGSRFVTEFHGLAASVQEHQRYWEGVLTLQ